MRAKHLFLAMLLGLLAAVPMSGQTYWDGTSNKVFSGSGTEADPYLISTPELAAYQARFERQLTASPDPQAPLLPKTSPDYKHNTTKLQRRRYYTLATFLRAIISMELKALQ